MHLKKIFASADIRHARDALPYEALLRTSRPFTRKTMRLPSFALVSNRPILGVSE
jgi:hypothetical protein